MEVMLVMNIIYFIMSNVLRMRFLALIKFKKGCSIIKLDENGFG